MFAFIKGNIRFIKKDYVCVDNNSIGYKVFTNNTNLFNVGELVEFYVNDVIKDEEIYIYGFQNQPDLTLFNQLITVSGVGFKTAFSLFNNLSGEQIVYFIKTNNANVLSSISGVGCKAQRIILELKNKIDQIYDNNFIEYKDVFEALKSLGYKICNISKVLSCIKPGYSNDECLKLAIKEIKNYEC